MIYFVGAGPGDPELITLKGHRLLQQAQLVVYTGSLINPELLPAASPESRLVDSSSLELEEIVDLMQGYYQEEKLVVRLHTGDASIYGAIGEQMRELENRDIPYRQVPGISSFLAAAASLQREYTVPGGSQTLILTRMEGNTPVPEEEKLSFLAQHRASLAVFLSASLVEKVQEELLQGYPPHTPVAVVYKASWPEEMVLEGNLERLAQLTREAGISKTALILVGDFLQTTGNSKLYYSNFSHSYREAKHEGE